MTANIEDEYIELPPWYTADEVSFLGGLSVFVTITQRPARVLQTVWDLFCHCKSRVGWVPDSRWLWICADCRLPRAYYAILFECDNCEDWFRSPQLPERKLICPGCIAANE